MGYHLFEVTGIELEYMLVGKADFKVAPVVDELFIEKTGEITSDVDNGKIEWSNELVAHVVELKTNGPTKELDNLDLLFSENIKEVNGLLSHLNAKLWPTGAHPLMDPHSEMKLWPHNYNEIYSLYNRVFDCHGHGWSNVQSIHINLPFFDDAEFEKLHAAIRILLPIIPALSASSPILDGKFTGFKDARMEMYKTNQKEIPEMTGMVIPEQVFDKESYYQQIFDPINKAIKPYDTEHLLDHHFLNSRGAIARFDRNAIEIRVIDIQESPAADIAIAILIIEALKLLISEEWITLEDQKSWNEKELFQLFNGVVQEAEASKIENLKYLNIFDLNRASSAGEIWEKVYKRVKTSISERHQKTIEFILENGSLSTRILKAVNNDFSKKNLHSVYEKLAECLQENTLFRS
ncbi:MAG: glutamate-cysteine ligase family protein [Gillisia sp.]